jgi:hypothetical protein
MFDIEYTRNIATSMGLWSGSYWSTSNGISYNKANDERSFPKTIPAL